MGWFRHGDLVVSGEGETAQYGVHGIPKVLIQNLLELPDRIQPTEKGESTESHKAGPEASAVWLAEECTEQTELDDDQDWACTY